MSYSRSMPETLTDETSLPCPWSRCAPAGTAYLQSLPLPRLSSRIIMSASGGRDALAFPALRCFRLLVLLSVIIVLMLMLHTLVVLISLEEPDL